MYVLFVAHRNTSRRNRRDIYLFVDAFGKLRKATIIFVICFHLSVCLSVWNNSAPTKPISIKFNV
jgi:hypothetical protein